MELLEMFGERQAIPNIIFQELLSVKNIESIDIHYSKTDNWFTEGYTTYFYGTVKFKANNTALSQKFEGTSIFDVLN